MSASMEVDSKPEEKTQQIDTPLPPPSTKERESVKAPKIKRPMTEKRIAQLAAARAAHSRKAAEKRQQSGSKPRDSDDKHVSTSPRLVKKDGEAASRYVDFLKGQHPSTDVSLSQPKGRSGGGGGGSKKRKESPNSDLDLKSAAMAGVALAAVAGITYVAGKNLNPGAMRSGFYGHGSAIPADQTTGQAAIPVQDIIGSSTLPRLPMITVSSANRPGAPSLGLFSQS
jgi:hypothetical protein